MDALQWVEDADSTQDLASALAETGAPHGTAVAARAQRQGRGSRGRTWHAPIGGVWLSLICRPAAVTGVEVTSLRTGLLVADAIESTVGAGLPPLAVKWPNDLLLDGKKVAGILAEARWRGATLEWIVIGIGINVVNPIDRALLPQAARLADYARIASVEGLAAACAHAVAAGTAEGGPLTAAEQAAFARRDALRGRTLRAPHPGVADGIAPDGRLWVVDDAHPAGRILVTGSVELA